MKYLIALIFLLSGCVYCQVDTVQGVPIEKFREQVLTPEAAKAVEHINVFVGPLGFTKPNAGFAAGTSRWSYIPLILLLGTTERSIIFENLPTKEMLRHEYLHHLDDMTRDEEGDFIRAPEFRSAQARHPYVKYLLRNSRTWVTDTFGIGESSEEMAWFSEKDSRIKAFSKMPHVYRKVFKDIE